jgi:hypothetical protein
MNGPVRQRVRNGGSNEPSPRNRVRNQPGMLFGFTPEPCLPSPGIRNRYGDVVELAISLTEDFAEGTGVTNDGQFTGPAAMKVFKKPSDAALTLSLEQSEPHSAAALSSVVHAVAAAYEGADDYDIASDAHNSACAHLITTYRYALEAVEHCGRSEAEYFSQVCKNDFGRLLKAGARFTRARYPGRIIRVDTWGSLW